MTDVRDATEDLLADRPGLEPVLRELLAVDEDHDTWTFDDAPMDSGVFGELVSRGIVEKTGGEYAIADRTAVESVLLEETPDDDEGTGFDPGAALSSYLESVSRAEALAVAAGLALVVLARTVLVAELVFRDGNVVLAGNDPYRFRYWVGHLLASDLSAFDPGALGSLPDTLLEDDVLMFVAMWWLAALAGGTPGAADQVLAWYPVVAAVPVGLAVYWMARRLTGDRRVAVASLLLFALLPVSGYRMMLGFGDHHAFDYLWLALTAAALLAIVTRQDDSADGWSAPDLQESLLAIALGVGVAGQVLAWRGGPLVVLPVALYVLTKAFLDVRDDRAVHRGSEPLVGGLAVATVCTVVPYALWGWLPAYRAFAPALLLGGTVGTLAVTEWGRRRGLDVTRTATLLGGGGLGVAGLLWVLVPAVSAGVTGFVGYMQAYTASGIAETYSLVSPELGLFVAPVLLFSFVLFLAVVPMVRKTAAAVGSNDAGWLAAGTYAWFFLLLSLVQIRFAGQLAVFVGVFGGVGFVRLTHWLDITTDVGGSAAAVADGLGSRATEDSMGPVALSVPDRGTLLQLGVVFLMVTSLSFVQIPVKQHQVAVDDTTYEAAVWMDGYADDRGWEYPSDYVFSPWSRNHVYNHFVNGQTASYGFAKENYQQFVFSRSPGEWYERLHDRTGFVVTRDQESAPPDSTQARLHRNYGSASGNVSGLSHYRLVYVGDDGSLAVFTLVPGATVSGSAQPNATVSATVTVDVRGTEFTYRRTVETGPDGRYQFTTPYPGTYTVGDATVTVPEAAVVDGEPVNATSR